MMNLIIPDLLSEYINYNDNVSIELNSLYEEFTCSDDEKAELLERLAYAGQSVKESDSRIYKNLVEFCLKNTYLDIAELFCIRLLLCNPKGWWAFNQLKNISKNNVQVSREATQDTKNLSPDLLKKYFPTYEHNYIDIKSYTASLISRHSAFNEIEQKSRKAFTLEIKEGKLWFDGFNYVVWDKDGYIIDEVSAGNCEIIDVISRTMVPNKIEGTACLLGGRISSNYYHWMYDSLPRICVLEKSGFSRCQINSFVVTGITKTFQKETLKSLGIDSSKIYSTFASGSYVTADNLFIPSYGSNENLIRNRCAPGDNLHLLQGKWASEFLREEFLEISSATNPDNDKYIYISRGRNDSRNFANESELVNFLVSKGIDIVDPQVKSVLEQAEYFSKAKVIIAAHGAALTNAVFCKPGTRIVEMHGPFTASCFWIISHYMGLQHYTYLTDESKSSIRKLHGQDKYSSLEQFRLKPLHLALHELSVLIDLVQDNTVCENETYSDVA